MRAGLLTGASIAPRPLQRSMPSQLLPFCWHQSLPAQPWLVQQTLHAQLTRRHRPSSAPCPMLQGDRNDPFGSYLSRGWTLGTGF